MTHATLKTFGYPATLVHEYRHWCVLLRPAQVTLASLVMVCKSHETQFSAISDEAFAEMSQVTKDIEANLAAFRKWDKINYLMLMMVDRHVHFHVIPRYGDDQVFEGTVFADAGWPAVPQLGKGVTPEPAVFEKLLSELKAVWA
jgi:diadenosine tetraphosphate (Ap4A) HIT family hydrolase